MPWFNLRWLGSPHPLKLKALVLIHVHNSPQRPAETGRGQLYLINQSVTRKWAHLDALNQAWNPRLDAVESAEGPFAESFTFAPFISSVFTSPIRPRFRGGPFWLLVVPGGWGREKTFCVLICCCTWTWPQMERVISWQPRLWFPPPSQCERPFPTIYY